MKMSFEDWYACLRVMGRGCHLKDVGFYHDQYLAGLEPEAALAAGFKLDQPAPPLAPPETAAVAPIDPPPLAPAAAPAPAATEHQEPLTALEEAQIGAALLELEGQSGWVVRDLAQALPPELPPLPPEPQPEPAELAPAAAQTPPKAPERAGAVSTATGRSGAQGQPARVDGVIPAHRAVDVRSLLVPPPRRQPSPPPRRPRGKTLDK